MKGRTPTAAEQRHISAVASMGCLICKREFGIYSPASPHHVDGRTKPGAHMKLLPLCFLHHQGGNNTPEYVSVHPYKRAFYARYGSEAELLAAVDELLKKGVAA